MDFAKIKVFVVGLFLLSSLKADLVTPEFLSDYRREITKAEFYCEQTEENENAPLKDKQETLENLYDYKNTCAEYLNDEENNDGNPDYLRVENVFLPLTKELIRYLEVHIERVHGPEGATHFARIAKPIVWAGILTTGLCVAAHILENNGVLPKPSKDQKAQAGESIEEVKKYIRELGFIQASLHEGRKKNKVWIELDNRYQKALQTFKDISEKVGISKEETEKFLQQTESAEQQHKEASQKLDEKQQKAVAELKKNDNMEKLRFIAQTILQRNDIVVERVGSVEKHAEAFRLSLDEAQTLQELSGLDKKKSDPDHINRVLAKSTNILPHMRAVRDVLSRRKQESLKLEDIIKKVEAIDKVGMPIQ